MDGLFDHSLVLDAISEKVEIITVAGSATIAGGLAYIGVAALLRVRELNTLMAILVDVVRRRRGAE